MLQVRKEVLQTHVFIPEEVLDEAITAFHRQRLFLSLHDVWATKITTNGEWRGVFADILIADMAVQATLGQIDETLRKLHLKSLNTPPLLIESVVWK